jgi:hypothetical protein
MNTGYFGFKIGKKLRLMKIDAHMDILLQICVREMYLLLKHHVTADSLLQAFQQLKDASGKITPKVLERCTYVTDIDMDPQAKTWEAVTRYCQCSFINILESGYFLNNGTKNGKILLIDFNKQAMYLYNDMNKKEESRCATFDEIRQFDQMPTIDLDTLLHDMKDKYHNYETQLNTIRRELERVESIVKKTKELGSDQNILTKAQHLQDTLRWDIQKINIEYRFFYHRLHMLDLIEYD